MMPGDAQVWVQAPSWALPPGCVSVPLPHSLSPFSLLFPQVTQTQG